MNWYLQSGKDSDVAISTRIRLARNLNGFKFNLNSKNEINRLCSKLVETATNSTYSRENNINNIDYYKHIRNAVSHSKCSYTKINGVCYVNFYDTNVRDKNQTCHIIIKTLNVGIILEQLQKQLIEFLNMELNKRK